MSAIQSPDGASARALNDANRRQVAIVCADVAGYTRLMQADEDDTHRTRLMNTRHSRLPVSHANPDNIIGVIQARELLAAMLSGQRLDIRGAVRPAPMIPDTPGFTHQSGLTHEACLSLRSANKLL